MQPRPLARARRRARHARRALAFEHCEPRLALSGTASDVLSFDPTMLSVSGGDEGGFVEYSVNIGGQDYTLSPVLDNLHFDGETTAIVVHVGDTSDAFYRWQLNNLGIPSFNAVTDLNDSRWSTIGDARDGDVTLVAGDLRPVQIPATPSAEPADEGGPVVIAQWPADAISPCDPVASPPQLADLPAVVPPATVSPAAAIRPGGAQPAATHIEGLRGRAVMFDVAAQSPTSSHRLDQPLAHAPSPAQHVAAVDAAHSTGDAWPRVGQAASESLDDSVVRAIAVRQGESAIRPVTSATAPQTSSATRDQALADESLLSSSLDTAALFDPTRNRPILGVAGASLLLAAWSVYGPPATTDRAAVEQHPPRRTAGRD